jgi:hypothetical protein
VVWLVLRALLLAVRVREEHDRSDDQQERKQATHGTPPRLMVKPDL